MHSLFSYFFAFRMDIFLQHSFVNHVTIFLPYYHEPIKEDVLDNKQKTALLRTGIIHQDCVINKDKLDLISGAFTPSLADAVWVLSDYDRETVQRIWMKCLRRSQKITFLPPKAAGMSIITMGVLAFRSKSH